MNAVEFLASERCNVAEIAAALRMSEARVRRMLRPVHRVIKRCMPPSEPVPTDTEWLALLHRCWPLGAGGVGPAMI